MRRACFVKAVLLSMALVLTGAPLAMADDTTIQIFLNGYSSPIAGHSGWYGGEFALSGLNGPGVYADSTKNQSNAPSFETFCIEFNEDVFSGANYHWSISDRAIKGGNAEFDQISIGTAYLYNLFAIGQLDYAYTGGNTARSADAGLLQNAIWWLEGENGLSRDYSNEFENLVVSLWGEGGAKVNNNYVYPVRVVNVWTNSAHTGLAQDQLIYVGDGSPITTPGPVPEPATMILVGTGLLGMGIFKRKSNKG
jgi:hypothetical protein